MRSKKAFEILIAGHKDAGFLNLVLEVDPPFQATRL